MAFILGMRVAVADHQEKRLAGCLPLEKRTRFGGNDLGQIAFLAHSFAIPAHARHSARQQSGHARRRCGRADQMILEASAGLRNLVDMRRPDLAVAAASKHPRAEAVSDDQNDTGALRRTLLTGEYRHTGTAQYK